MTDVIVNNIIRICIPALLVTYDGTSVGTNMELNLVCSSHSRIFHSNGDVTITGEGLQILAFARHSWPLSSEGSLACHTYGNTGHPFIMVISEGL